MRLKRHESSPSPDFVERFLEDFQRRQRAELLQKSSLSLLWERLQMRFGALLSPRAAYAYAAIAAAAVLAWMLLPAGGQARAGGNLAGHESAAAAKKEPFIVDGVRIMLEVEAQPDIEPAELADHLSDDAEEDLIVVPTSQSKGIAVPVKLLLEAVEQANGR